MYDLIYADEEAKADVRKQYPDAKIEDESDYVHPDRFSFEVPDEGFDMPGYYRFMIREGLASASFNINLAMREAGVSHDALMEAVRELKAEDEANVPVS